MRFGSPLGLSRSFSFCGVFRLTSTRGLAPSSSEWPESPLVRLSPVWLGSSARLGSNSVCLDRVSARPVLGDDCGWMCSVR